MLSGCLFPPCCPSYGYVPTMLYVNKYTWHHHCLLLVDLLVLMHQDALPILLHRENVTGCLWESALAVVQQV